MKVTRMQTTACHVAKLHGKPTAIQGVFSVTRPPQSPQAGWTVLATGGGTDNKQDSGAVYDTMSLGQVLL